MKYAHIVAMGISAHTPKSSVDICEQYQKSVHWRVSAIRYCNSTQLQNENRAWHRGVEINVYMTVKSENELD